MPAPTVFNAATSQWVHHVAILNPTGGTPDAEARTATNAILVALRDAGVIAGATQLNISHTWNGATNQVVGRAAIAAPAGGATIDTNCRATINSIRAVLQNAGIIGGATTTLGAHAFDEDYYGWKVGAFIADVTVGGTTDAECRAVIASALVAMRRSSLIAAD